MISKIGIRFCTLALFNNILVHVVVQTKPNEEKSSLTMKILKNYTSEILGPAYDEADTIYFLENINNTQFMSKYTISTNSFSRLLEEPIGRFKDIIFSYGIHAGKFLFIADRTVFKFDITTNSIAKERFFRDVYAKSTFVVDEDDLFFVSPPTSVFDNNHYYIVRLNLISNNPKTVAAFQKESDHRVFLASDKSRKIYAIILEAGHLYEYDRNKIVLTLLDYLDQESLKGEPSSPKYILPVGNLIVYFTTGIHSLTAFYVHLPRRVTISENLSTTYPATSSYPVMPIHAKSTRTIYVFVESQILKAVASVEACRGISEDIATKTVYATQWSSLSLKCDIPKSSKRIIEWFRGHEPAVEDTIESSAELVLKHGSLNQTSTYKCVSESICNVQEQVIHLQVSARTPSALHFSGLAVVPGSNVSFDCYPEQNNVNSMTIVWLKNGVFWDTTLDSRVHKTRTGLAILGVSEADGGNYTCLLDTSFHTSYGVTNNSENFEFELIVGYTTVSKTIYANTTTSNGDGASASNFHANYFLFVLILVPIVLIATYWFYKVRNRNSLGLTVQEIREFKEGRHTPDEDVQYIEQLADTKPYDTNYELPAYAFKIQRENTLGEGQFGVVYRGVLKLDDKVEDAAFKTAKNMDHAKEHLKSLLSEIKILIYVGRHPSIIRLFGAYTRQLKSGVLYLALEFCPNGSLERYLRSSKHASVFDNQYENAVNLKCITNTMLLDWSMQIATGMDYLASKKVIHSDLATRNVLLAQDLSARITDFGLSRRLQNYENYVKTGTEPLPWRWMALESLEHRNFSTESDVWSFGVTLWEMFSMGKIPFHNQTWSTVFIEQLKAGEHLPLPTHASEEIFDIMKRCWDLDVMKRPKFKELENCLQQIIYKNKNIIYE